MLMKVARSELSGYLHVRLQFADAEARAHMNIKLTIFTVFFCLMCIENTFRILDFMMGWQFPIPAEDLKNLDTGSD